MSTGYTYDLTETDIEVTRNDFIMKCARAMGPFAAMPDDRFDAPIPEDLGICLTYHSDGVQKYEALVAYYERMTEQEYLALRSEKNEQSIKAFEKALVKTNISRQRVQDMIDQVNAWTPPSEDHQPLKDFMLEQLTSTLGHEIDAFAFYWQEQIELIKARDPVKDFEMDVENAKRSLEYHRKELEKQQKYKAWAINWIKELQTSL